jgi:hypothetical protein
LITRDENSPRWQMEWVGMPWRTSNVIANVYTVTTKIIQSQWTILPKWKKILITHVCIHYEETELVHSHNCRTFVSWEVNFKNVLGFNHWVHNLQTSCMQ